jgi:hypothetical protein
MRHLRLALALLLALALPADGLLSRAAGAHRLAAAALQADLCVPGTDRGTPGDPAPCDDHCRAAASGDAGTRPTAVARPLPAAIGQAAAALVQAPRVPHRPTFDHAPRAPPAAA